MSLKIEFKAAVNKLTVLVTVTKSNESAMTNEAKVKLEKWVTEYWRKITLSKHVSGPR